MAPPVDAGRVSAVPLDGTTGKDPGRRAANEEPEIARACPKCDQQYRHRAGNGHPIIQYKCDQHGKRPYNPATSLGTSSHPPNMKIDFVRAATGLATTASLQSQINVKSVLNSIQTYATPGALSGAQHGALESTLHAPVADTPLLYNAPYVASPRP